MFKRDIPLATWGYITLIIVAILIPIVVGIAVTKIYRVYKPIEKNQLQGLAAVGHSTRDGFIKMTLIGWLICLPIYIVLYQIYAS